MSVKYESYRNNVDKELEARKKRALEAVGGFVVSETVDRTPVKTGHLQGSYAHEVVLAEEKVMIGTPTEYAIYVEKGTYKMSAQPHLTPAAEDNLSRITSLIEELMSK